MFNLKRGFPKEIYMVFVEKDEVTPIVFQTFKGAAEYMKKCSDRNLVLFSVTGPAFRLIDIPKDEKEI